MEDPQKVQAKLDELNETHKKPVLPSSSGSLPPITYPPIWIAVGGYFSMLKTSLNDKSEATFFGNEGLPIKVFLNTLTGEMKFYPAKSFEQNR